MENIIIGVDTHKSNHIAVAIDARGVRLGSTTIPTTRQGYRDLQAWAAGLGRIKAFGIEGTGSHGAGLSRDLLARGHVVLDVMHPNRQLRSPGLERQDKPDAPEPRRQPSGQCRNIPRRYRSNARRRSDKGLCRQENRAGKNPA